MAIAGRNILARAKNGTGKTAAFAIPVLEKCQINKRAIQGTFRCFSAASKLCIAVKADINGLSRDAPLVAMGFCLALSCCRFDPCSYS